MGNELRLSIQGKCSSELHSQPLQLSFECESPLPICFGHLVFTWLHCFRSLQNRWDMVSRWHSWWIQVAREGLEIILPLLPDLPRPRNRLHRLLLPPTLSCFPYTMDWNHSQTKYSFYDASVRYSVTRKVTNTSSYNEKESQYIDWYTSTLLVLILGSFTLHRYIGIEGGEVFPTQETNHQYCSLSARLHTVRIPAFMLNKMKETDTQILLRSCWSRTIPIILIVNQKAKRQTFDFDPYNVLFVKYSFKIKCPRLMC